MNKPLYFASPRDIYDALFSSPVKASLEFLHYFLVKRGHFLGGAHGRDELCQYVSRLPLSYSDIEEISKQLESSQRKEKKTAKRVKIPFNLDLFSKAIEQTNRFRGEKLSETVQLISDNGKQKIQLTYISSDLGLTTLRQNKIKQETIEIIQKNNELKFEYSDNPRVDEVVSAILSEIEQESGDLETSEINLSNFTKQERTEFFKELISNIDGFTYHDVIKVSVDFIIDEPEFIQKNELNSDENDDEDAEEDQSFDRLAKSTAEDNVKSFLRKAALDGNGILESRHLDEFLSAGFYLSRIVWQSIKNDKNGAKIEFEALLKKPASGCGFVFNIRGQYNRKKDQTFNTTRISAGENEAVYLDAVESKALEIQNRIISKRNPNGKDKNS